MSQTTLRRKFAAGLTALATAASLVVGAPALVGAQATEQGSSASLGSGGSAGSAGATPPAPAFRPAGGDENPVGFRNRLRPGCVWDQVASWVQLCEVWSPAMNRHIKVQIQPARFGGNAGLYLLDGLRARDDWNAWTHDAQAQRIFLQDNITLVMPVGGQASFYSDWDRPINLGGNILEYKYETFLTKELPGYLWQNFGVAGNNNAVAGLSMGGSAAAMLAANHSDQFKQASVFSGYMNTTAPGMYTMLPLAMFDQCKCDPFAMWGLPGSPRWGQNDPLLNAGKLRNVPMYITAGSAIPGKYDQPTSLQAVFNTFNGIILEGLSRGSTIAFQNTMNAQPNKATFDYRTTGVHGWGYWNDDLVAARSAQILDVMNAHAW
ncbi:alpha/beta hydrolase family protein [Rhodococcus sp. IEGM 1408]|uniref:alpha/beta hydrolase n=1 Tax=Rhodococcus sp. IEGM 1408 TaxID=3082220 RepID=UPI00295305B9|nr:alpha/beta hydrolase family protein [Rhodococcus sp. IEGM 1408]MDV8002094.1 alpha/beta hydrolase family protein [Rhodococcus sp. IEGM 1408]